MFSPRDTIVALSTPPGRGGIGVVRLSGPRAHEIARMMLAVGHDLEPRHATLTQVVGEAGAPIDEVVATFFAAPHSYTTEDVVEISAHGSPALLRAIVAAAMRVGARLAEPGEFTLRAFLNSRLDLVQAEAVADLVDAVTPLQARVALDQLEGTLTRAIAALDGQLFDLVAQLEASLDFPDEGYHFGAHHEVATALGRVRDGIDALLATARGGRVIREGRQMAILGKPNVGKSTLFNALVGSDRAIVTAAPGTTRDLVTEHIDFDGIRLGLVDTAGIRDAQDEAEQQGVVRARHAAEVADLVVLVLDLSRPLEAVDWDLVREIDALGGLMGLAIDATGIQFKLLNRSRGAAVWSPRAQADKRSYSAWVRSALEAQPNIEWVIGRAGELLIEDRVVRGINLERGEAIRSRSVIVTTGTFLNGLIHIGLERFAAGRAGEAASGAVAESIRGVGFRMGRLKTGTPPRLHRNSIDFERAVSQGWFKPQSGDTPPVPLSFMTGRIERDQIQCYVVHTTDAFVNECWPPNDAEFWPPSMPGLGKPVGSRFNGRVEGRRGGVQEGPSVAVPFG